ncbi:MAG: glutamine-hydrolyzing carbamoyl-phosphate synthase small subunit [Candidatus Margulisiibacteriota bacterium]
MKGILMLEDGAYFEGEAFGSCGTAFGEAVFNTGMTGYQEVLTDPSYQGQIVTMTYPLIGNYGVNPDDTESRRIFASGFVVRQESRIFSSWRAQESLGEYLKKNAITGLCNVDTRAITRHIRNRGAMRSAISTEDLDIGSLHKKVLASRSMNGADLAKEVSCKAPYRWEEGRRDFLKGSAKKLGSQHQVVVYDFGVKHNILRILSSLNCRVMVVPGTTAAEEVLKMKPDGVLFSNGPGDPSAVSYGIEAAQKLAGKLPIFGICLGHQILALAFGAKTFKLKFGHRGSNHPVKDLRTGKVEITSQNHGFAVEASSFKNTNIEITHINLNDGTCEGFSHKFMPVFSVQYHPEASPGPLDSQALFNRFVSMMEKKQ